VKERFGVILLIYRKRKTLQLDTSQIVY